MKPEITSEDHDIIVVELDGRQSDSPTPLSPKQLASQHLPKSGLPKYEPRQGDTSGEST